jgi:transposase-like protein
MPKRYPQDQRERAVRMVLDHLSEYDSVFAACSAIGPKLNIGRESLRRWVLQAPIDADERPGVTSAEQTRIRELERENQCWTEPDGADIAAPKDLPNGPLYPFEPP